MAIFDEDKSFELWAYNIETVLAEKVETILRRTVFNTRPRDFYDAYILATTQKFDRNIFKDALRATAKHRGTTEQISNVGQFLKNISEIKDKSLIIVTHRKKALEICNKHLILKEGRIEYDDSERSGVSYPTA